MQNTWKLVSAFGIIYAGIVTMTPLPYPNLIGAICIFIGLLMVGHYFLEHRTELQFFKGFICRRINDLERYSKNSIRIHEEVRFWEDNILQGFKRACGRDVSDAIFEAFSHTKNLCFNHYQRDMAIDKIIESHILYLKTWLSNTPPIASNFKCEDLKKLEKNIRPTMIEKCRLFLHGNLKGN